MYFLIGFGPRPVLFFIGSLGQLSYMFLCKSTTKKIYACMQPTISQKNLYETYEMPMHRLYRHETLASLFSGNESAPWWRLFGTIQGPDFSYECLGAIQTYIQSPSNHSSNPSWVSEVLRKTKKIHRHKCNRRWNLCKTYCNTDFCMKTYVKCLKVI